MKSQTFGELEKQIMEIVWKHDQCSVRDVLNQINDKKKLAYTTVATVLQRLFDKGILARKEDKSGYIYSTKITKEEYGKNVAQSFLQKFIDSFGDIAIASFAASIDKLPKKKREYFLQLLENYEKDK